MNNKKSTGYYRIGLLISIISVAVTAVVVTVRPLAWLEEVSPVLLYCFVLCFPGIQLLTVGGLQFMDLYNKKRWKKAETEEEKSRVSNDNRVGSYLVVFLSVEYFAMWLAILYKVMPAAMKMENGEIGDFLDSLFKLLAILLSVMFIFLGNYIPLSRGKGQGFSCRWSEYNANTKIKTNRYAGKVFVVAGLISTAVSIIFNGYIGMGTMIIALVAAQIVSSKKSKEYYLEEIAK